ncbi:hypothetical protein C8J56DRAFT_1037777 [Mycena floridula]|nr:hypothetical protein C8J56DRAFT_1037777 [Mycena floridula]
MSLVWRMGGFKIDMVVEQSVQELDTREYYAAFVAMHAASLYSGVNPSMNREALTVRFSNPTSAKGYNPYHRNYRRQLKHEKKLKATAEPIAFTLPCKVRKRNEHEAQRGTLAMNTAVGFGALGICAFHLKVNLSDEEHTETKARLDSGADVTLILEEFFEKLKGLPSPKSGLCMKLFSLTGNAKVLGYTTFDIEVEALNRAIVSFAVEAYVCQGMIAPLLLGEDFSSTYAINQHHMTSRRNHISFGDSNLTIPALAANHVDLGFATGFEI